MDILSWVTAGTVAVMVGATSVAVTRIAITRMALRGTKPEERIAILHALADLFRSRVKQ
jgi:hypothetical protein